MGYTDSNLVGIHNNPTYGLSSDTNTVLSNILDVSGLSDDSNDLKKCVGYILGFKDYGLEGEQKVHDAKMKATFKGHDIMLVEDI